MVNRIRRWLRAVFRRNQLDREMVAEMEAHIDLAAARLVARGMPPDEARFAARREFGNLGYLEEQGRDARGAVWVESVRSDLRFAWRALRASPAFATVAILSLAIGIGANTAIFSLIDAVVLKSLPVERPEELVRLTMKDIAAPTGRGDDEFTNPLWEQLRNQTESYAQYAVSGDAAFNLAAGGESRTASAQYINGEYFTTLGVLPAAGRLVAKSDDFRGCPGIAVASYGFWQSELGGRDDAIGRPVLLSSRPYTLIGVTSPDFFGVEVGRTIQLYIPLCAERLVQGQASALDERSTWWLTVLARPKPGVSATRLDARLRAVSPGVFEAAAPSESHGRVRRGFLGRFFSTEAAGNGISAVRGQYAKALLVLMGIVGIILLISCANVANLLLARGVARSREIAIRLAIGASRARLMRQFFAESMLLAFAGAMLAVVGAEWGSRFLLGMLGTTGPNGIALDLGLDPRVLAFTASVSVATALLFGLAPAWRATRVDPQSAMKSGGRGNIDGRSHFRIGKALVVAQCALALVLVVGAGLLVGTFRRLASLDLGFNAANVIIARVDLGQTSIPPARFADVQNRMLEQIRTIPHVVAASADLTPLSGAGQNGAVIVDGAEDLIGKERISLFNTVSDGFFRAMGTRLIAGRDFTNQDRPGSPEAAIVNRAMVDRFFHGASPLGKVYRTEFGGVRSPPVTIVGVVDNAKYRTIREKPQPIIYLPASRDSTRGSSATYVLRVTESPAMVVRAMNEIVAGVNPKIALSFKMLSDQVAGSLRRERVLAMLSGFFGVVALALAMIGLYGTMAYSVAQRRVEIGIRIALGAPRSRVVRLVLGDVGRLIAIGVILGTVAAIAATRLLGSFLFGVTANDPFTIAMAAGLLATAALVAGAIPVRRAARLEAVDALREE